MSSTEAGFHFPEDGEIVTSSFEPVCQLEPSTLESFEYYAFNQPWAIGDAFVYMDSLGLLVPDRENLRYKRKMGWGPVPDDHDFQSGYCAVRNAIIHDAVSILEAPMIRGVIEISNTGPEPANDNHYDQEPHLDVVSLLGQRVLLYFGANKNTTRLFKGSYHFAEFTDYSRQPDFADLTEHRPEPGQLVRGEAITLLHAGNEPTPNRIFIRAFVEVAQAA